MDNLRQLVNLSQKRRDYASHIIACADTVTLLRPDEVDDIYARAMTGEFDEDLNWRSPYLKVTP